MMFSGAENTQSTDRIVARKNDHFNTLFPIFIKGEKFFD